MAKGVDGAAVVCCFMSPDYQVSFSNRGNNQDPVVQSPISTNPGLTINKTYEVEPGLALIEL